jgi:hypothetical protein
MSLSDAHYFEEMGVKKYEEIHSLLDSREKKDKLEGMKRLIAMISIGRDASNFFPDVVKNVVCDSLEVKKLVYMFLTHYAELKSNEALLTINTFQKDLSDTNQVGFVWQLTTFAANKGTEKFDGTAHSFICSACDDEHTCGNHSAASGSAILFAWCILRASHGRMQVMAVKQCVRDSSAYVRKVIASFC